MFFSASTIAWAQLRLVVEDGGGRYPVMQVVAGQIMAMRGGQSAKFDESATFRVEGELGADASTFLWFPDYTIIRTNEAKRRRNPTEYLGAISISQRNVSGVNRTAEDRGILAAWPAARDAESIAVFVWLVDRKIENVKVVPISPSHFGGQFTLKEEFPLTDYSRRGQGAILWWQNGRFFKPRDAFADPGFASAATAARLNDTAQIQRSLAAGLDPNAADPTGVRLIYLAAEAGSEEVFDVLLNAGASVLSNVPERSSVVRGAARTEREGVVRQIITLPLGDNIMHRAAAKGRENVVRKIIAAKGPLGGSNQHHETPLHVAAKSGHLPSVEALLNAGAVGMPNRSISSETAFSASITYGYAEQARIMLGDSERLMSPNGYRYRFDFLEARHVDALIQQARIGNADVVEALLKMGVRHYRNGLVLSALQAAAEGGNVRSITLLLDAGAKLDDLGQTATPPLAIAVRRGFHDCADTLLAAGADVHWRDERGDSLLHVAAAADDVKLMAILLAHGARAGQLNAAGLSPLATALIANSAGAAALLADRGERLNAVGAATAAVVDGVLRLDRADLLAHLIKDGFDPSFPLRDGWGLLEVAQVYRASGCVAILEAMAVSTAPQGASGSRLASLGTVTVTPQPVRSSIPLDPRDLDEEFSETTVRVDVVISEQGTVLFPKILEPVDPRLRLAVLRAVSQWQFTPPLSGDKPVAMQLRLPLVFPSSRNRVFTADQVETPPRVVARTTPLYPQSRRGDASSGPVIVRVLVNRFGLPETISTVQSPHSDFSQAASDAVSSWRFEPAMRDGRTVNAVLTFPLEFIVP